MKSQATNNMPQINNFSLNKGQNNNSETKKLSLLFVITQGVWGGSQRYVFDLVTELSKKHTLTVAIGEISGAKDLQQKFAQHTDVKLIQLKHLQRAIHPWHDILALFELKKLFQTIRPDIVHLNSTKAGILGSFTSGFFSHTYKLVYTVHGWIFLEPLSPLSKSLFRFLEKITGVYKDAFILLSPQEKTIAEKELGLTEKKLHIIPLGISPPQISLTKCEARKKIEKLQQKSFSEKIWIATIAGLYSTKGLTEYLLTLAKYPQLQKYHYFIIGKGPQYTELQDIIQHHKLSNCVTLTGHIDNAAQLLPAFDLFVLPSKKEGLPYVLLEAIQSQIPIVATNVGGVASILPPLPQTRCIPPQNEEAFVEAIEKILSSNQCFTWPKNITSLEQMSWSTLSLYWSLLKPRQ